MRDRDDDDDVVGHEIGDVIREPVHRCHSNLEIGSNTVNEPRHLRELRYELDRPINRNEEHKSKTGATVVIPADGIVEFGDRFVDETGLERHPPRVSASRRRKIAQSCMSASPDNTRRARRSISSRHNAPTAEGSSSLGTSRLTNSSAARSARSATGKASSSRRRSSGAIATSRTLPPSQHDDSRIDPAPGRHGSSALRTSGKASSTPQMLPTRRRFCRRLVRRGYLTSDLVSHQRRSTRGDGAAAGSPSRCLPRLTPAKQCDSGGQREPPPGAPPTVSGGAPASRRQRRA